LPEDDYPPLVQQDAGAGNRGWNGILCPLGIFGDLYSTDSTAEKEDAAAKGCPTDRVHPDFNYQRGDGSILNGADLHSLPHGSDGHRLFWKRTGVPIEVN
jgi:hypothetical protein